jgi:hypothetical protein
MPSTCYPRLTVTDRRKHRELLVRVASDKLGCRRHILIQNRRSLIVDAMLTHAMVQPCASCIADDV